MRSLQGCLLQVPILADTEFRQHSRGKDPLSNQAVASQFDALPPPSRSRGVSGLVSAGGGRGALGYSQAAGAEGL
jgi:hypothetical protein